MIYSPPVDVPDTPVHQPSYYSDVGSKTCSLEDAIGRFHTIASETGSGVIVIWKTATGVTGSEPEREEIPPRQEADNAAEYGDNALRLRLLACKYAGKTFSKEDEARLEIVTRRVDGIMTSLETEAFEHLADTAERLAEIRATRQQIAERRRGK